jgi:hypothetical protein
MNLARAGTNRNQADAHRDDDATIWVDGLDGDDGDGDYGTASLRPKRYLHDSGSGTGGHLPLFSGVQVLDLSHNNSWIHMTLLHEFVKLCFSLFHQTHTQQVGMHQFDGMQYTYLVC